MNNTLTWDEVFSATYCKPAELVYCIAFTARSGSSWLVDLLTKTRKLGDPREYFNQEAASYAISQSGCRNVRDYFDHIRTVRQSDGVFGLKAAYHHMSKLMDEGYGDLLERVDAWFLLRRRDYVAQAVSLYRASRSGVFHSYQRQGDIADTPYECSPIVRFALGALVAEFHLAEYFRARAITPVELWYEDMVEEGAEAVIHQFLDRLGIDMTESEIAAMNIQPSFEKLADERSAALAEQFRRENPAFIAFWDQGRGRKTVPEFMAAHPEYLELNK